MNIIKLLILIFIILNIFTCSAIGQVDKPAPAKKPIPLDIEETDDDNDLDLPEVVIRGEDKTKITGEKVNTVEDSLNIITIDPLSISKAGKDNSRRKDYSELFGTTYSAQRRGTGFIKAGYGLLNTLEAEVFYGNYWDKFRYIFNFDHNSYSTDDSNSDFRADELWGGVSVKMGNNFQFGAEGKLKNKFYQLSALDSLQAERSQNELWARASVKGRLFGSTNVELYGHVGKNDIDFTTDTMDTTLKETQAGLDFRVTHLIDEQLVSWETKYLTSNATDLAFQNLDYDNRKNNLWNTKLFGNKTFLTDYALFRKISLKLGFSYYSYKNDAFSSTEISNFSPYGQISISPNVSPRELTVSFYYDSRLDCYTYDRIFELNPYSSFDIKSYPIKTAMRLGSKVNFAYNSDLNFMIDYTLDAIESFPIWQEEESLWNLTYHDINRQSILFTATYELIDKVTLEEKLEFQTYSDSPKDLKNIPYQPDITSRFSLNWYEKNNFSFDVALDYVGKVHTNHLSDEQLEDYLLLDLEINKQLKNNFQIFLKGYNTLNKKYQVWRGYNQPQNRILLGAGFKW